MQCTVSVAMDTTVMESPCHGSDLLCYMNTLYERDKLTDLTLVTEDQVFNAHRTVVTAFSACLKELLNVDTNLMQGKQELYVQNVKGAHMELLLSFMYTGKLPLRQNSVSLVLKSARKLGIASAVELCERYLAVKQEVDEGKVSRLQHVQSPCLDPLDNAGASSQQEDAGKSTSDLDTDSWTPKVTRKSVRRSQRTQCSKPSPRKRKKSPQRKPRAASRSRKKVAKKAAETKLETRHEKAVKTEADDRFCCVHCGKRFLYRSLKKLHEKTHKNLSLSAVARAQWLLLLRKRINLEPGAGYGCRICSKAFKLYTACRRHYTGSHKVSNTKCPDCTKSFYRQWRLNRHRTTQHSAATVTVKKCKHCSRVFRHQVNMLKHYGSCAVLHGKLLAGVGMYRCYHCSRTYKTAKNLEEHLVKNQLKSLSAEELVAQFDPDAKPSYKKKRKRSYSCDVCGKTYQKSKYVRVHKVLKHLMEDSSIKLMQCPEANCHFSTYYENQLKVHKKTHNQEKAFGCRICGKFLKTATILQVHMTTHLNPKSFICEQCGMTFARRVQLKEHMVRHDGIKRYSCTECSFASHNQKSLRSHMFNLHKVVTDSKVKIYQCEKCGYATTTHSYFKVHMKAHLNVKDIPCLQCGKMYATQMAMKQHVRCSHGPKSLKCNICGYKTNQRTKLKDHVRVTHTHPEHKPYKCLYCEFVCATSGNCRKHVMHRHKGREVTYERVGPKCPAGFTMPPPSVKVTQDVEVFNCV